MYLEIIAGALAVPGNDYLGNGHVRIDDIRIWLEDNYWYYDWRDNGFWKAGDLLPNWHN